MGKHQAHQPRAAGTSPLSRHQQLEFASLSAVKKPQRVAMTDVDHPSTAITTLQYATAAAATASSAASTSVRLLGSVARPVSAAAVQVFHTWVGAMSSGVRGAIRLRNEWNEAQQARRKMHELKAKYASDKVLAKEREKAAMLRLQQLEQQINFMQQQMLNQQASHAAALSGTHAITTTVAVAPASHSSVPMAPPMIPSAPSIVPTAPALAASSVPMAPPMTPQTAPTKTRAAVPSAKSPHFSSQSLPSNKPNAASLLLGASRLRSIAHPPRSSLKPRSPAAHTGGINLAMLKQVKLKQVTAPNSRASAANASFLFEALHARFHRSVPPPRNVSFTQRSSFGLAQTPIHGRHTQSSSAFSPMTPHTEEWTPAR